jgi:hypothetical protein
MPGSALLALLLLLAVVVVFGKENNNKRTVDKSDKVVLNDYGGRGAAFGNPFGGFYRRFPPRMPDMSMLMNQQHEFGEPFYGSPGGYSPQYPQPYLYNRYGMAGQVPPSDMFGMGNARFHGSFQGTYYILLPRAILPHFI